MNILYFIIQQNSISIVERIVLSNVNVGNKKEAILKYVYKY